MNTAKEARTQVCWYIKKSVLDEIKEKAKAEDRPVNWVVNRMLEQVVSKAVQQ